MSASEAAQGVLPYNNNVNVNAHERARDEYRKQPQTIRTVTPDDTPTPQQQPTTSSTATTTIPEDGYPSQTTFQSPPNSPRSHNSQLSQRTGNPRAYVARASSDSEYRNAREQTWHPAWAKTRRRPWR